ncbi:GntR family transcriptional regulator [Amycolatopsis granulosa]|uniref:GntR family transcriptional regulator n=1 Tax=Amycolatopsis granulosa TaxID=185684 RepID=UPI0014223EA2|nr:GntR family transcriptional regulator [Amycolatopsis granulosa]NIH87497.1 DNA-binding GntR family transcriptional regulator [Amycolatopsis granulosa]
MTEGAGSAPIATTRSAVVFEAIRAEILGGLLKPGARLPFAALVEKYDCSMGTLREALQRLVETGLVESFAQQGFRVVRLSDEDLADLTEARIDIEVAALRHAVREGDIAWEGAAVASLHVLERTPRHDETSPDHLTEEWAVAHAAFHHALLSGCRNRRLLNVAARFRDAAELYRRWSLPPARDTARDPDEEHRAILKAAVDRDEELACRLLREHIEKAASHLE